MTEKFTIVDAPQDLPVRPQMPVNVPLTADQKARILNSQRLVLLKENAILSAMAALPELRKRAGEELQEIARANGIQPGFFLNDELEIVKQ